MADYTPFPLSPWYDRPNVLTPARAHKMMAAGPNGSGGVASEMLSVDQIFSLMAANDVKPFADPLTKREGKTANYTATVDDNGKILAFTATDRTLTMPLAATAAAAADGYMLVVSAQVGALTIARSGTTDTIVGATSITLNQGETAILFLDAAGTGWRASISPPYNTVARTDLANVFTQRQHWAKGTTIASAASIALPSNGNFFDVSGTTTVTAISTVTQAGTRILLRATGAFTLQHNATSMILPRATNITFAVGDVVELISLGSGNYLLMSISKADGTALAGAALPFVSAQQTFSNGGAVTINHGLGKQPNLSRLELVCVAEDGGYAVGDVIEMPPTAFFYNSSPYGITARGDVTNFYLRVAASGLQAVTKTTFALFAITPANWRIVVRAQ